MESEPELEETEETPAQQTTTSSESSSEPQAPATTEVGAETEELYEAEDPRDDTEHDEPLAPQS